MRFPPGLKKRFSGKIGRQIRALTRFRADCIPRFGKNSPVVNAINTEIRYLRLNRFINGKILQKLGFKRIHPLSVIAKQNRIDLDAEWRESETEIAICGLAFPKPRTPQEWLVLRLETNDIVFPWFLRRTIPDFDRWYDEFYSLGTDWAEGPYEFGDVSLAEGDVVLDCGANLGMFSAVAARSGCRTYAFEAMPATIENYLAKTTALHPNISICPVAVWDREETLMFDLGAEHIGMASAVMRNDGKEREKVPVSAVRLDDWAEREGVTRVDFIKADIEGAERNLLRGAERILKTFAPKLALCTYHLPDDSEVLRELILRANPAYVVTERFKKLYAHVPKE